MIPKLKEEIEKKCDPNSSASKRIRTKICKLYIPSVLMVITSILSDYKRILFVDYTQTDKLDELKIKKPSTCSQK